MKKILSFFTYLFHPIFIPVFGTFLYFYFEADYFDLRQQLLIVLQVAILSVFIPISFFYLLKTLGKLDSMLISDFSKHKIALMIQMVLVVILIQKSITVDRIPELYFFLLGGLISSILVFSLLFCKIKVSISLLGISALVAFFVGLSIHNQANELNGIALLVLMNGFVAASQLEMKACTIKELGIGFVIGLMPQIGLWYFWL